ncbi:hypothetical protein L226DRAFT_192814 [Lentinus tigrinus ALCF2SS1-7]|uniref:Uncharacterized protein n=1 Tax=Lentinus tigrinus ALCF2SS1-6 TaxID=1328759 RepID=A0A5C2SS98_9APHY|nr:hypothetical protein L227DRAFT_137915 [Lentinus tigrinus ALCF2SS1-6]RPD80180.1 hypothetical protein L226DRAFT_192814 [Lentinus tigrinus ALCF2SS1-7]
MRGVAWARRRGYIRWCAECSGKDQSVAIGDNSRRLWLSVPVSRNASCSVSPHRHHAPADPTPAIAICPDPPLRHKTMAPLVPETFCAPGPREQMTPRIPKVIIPTFASSHTGRLAKSHSTFNALRGATSAASRARPVHPDSRYTHARRSAP